MLPFNSCWKSFLEDTDIDWWRRRASGLYEQGEQVYPQREYVFRAFNECPHEDLKVVIVGEEPYEDTSADGLAFSVPSRTRLPLSLCNILNEVVHDLGIAVKHDGDLVRWARQGVLLLNSRLTIGQQGPVRWKDFTRQVLRTIYRNKTRIVFMLWGEHAHASGRDLVNGRNNHLVLRASHPSPRSASSKCCPFVGCEHFRKASAMLAEQGREVNWK